MKKRLRIGRLILANIIITSIFVLLLLITPNIYEVNFVLSVMYIFISVIFNLFILE